MLRAFSLQPGFSQQALNEETTAFFLPSSFSSHTSWLLILPTIVCVLNLGPCACERYSPSSRCL